MAGVGNPIVNRRALITKTVPACAAVCAGICNVEDLAGACRLTVGQETHRFDQQKEFLWSERQRLLRGRRFALQLISSLRDEIGDDETIRILNLFSARRGRNAGTRRAEALEDTRFETFVSQIRPPFMNNTITYETAEDTVSAYGIRVTECLHSEVFRAANLGGEIGHAAFCNMDFHSAPAFNPRFRLERTKTLMQGHDHCNHRWIDGTA